MLPSSVHQISTLFYPSICRVLGLPVDTTSHQTDQESSLGVKGSLIVPVLILYCLFRDFLYTFTGHPDSSSCHLLSVVSRTNHMLSRNMIFLPWHPQHLLSYSCILFAFFFFFASALSYSPWLSNCQPNLPLSSDDPTMTTHRWKTHAWEGMHFYGGNIPEWERNCSRRGWGWWYSNFRVALSVCNWQVGVGVLLHMVRTGYFLRKFQAALLIIGAG